MVDAGLVSLLNKMVRYHFKDRYQSATELLALQPLAGLCRQLAELLLSHHNRYL